MSIGDERPRILDDEQAAILAEYGIDNAIDAAGERWRETRALQAAAAPIDRRLVGQHQVVSTLRVELEARLAVAEGGFQRKRTRATAAALQRARERLQLVAGEHAPLDSELHAEHKALAPVLDKIARAIEAIEKSEMSLDKAGRLPWYRRRVGGQGYLKKGAGPVALGHSTGGAWVAGHGDTEMATRSDEIWFSRAGADPIVALKIAQAVMCSVEPPPVTKNRGKFEHVQINRVLVLMKHTELNLPTSQISELLAALGYEPQTVSETALNRRLSDLRTRGHVQPIARGAKGSVLGRRRTRTKRRSTAVARVRIS